VNRCDDGGVDGRLCGSDGREPSSARRPGRTFRSPEPCRKLWPNVPCPCACMTVAI
jgi:hypothetical protein